MSAGLSDAQYWRPGEHIPQGFDPVRGVYRVELPAPPGMPDIPTAAAVERQHVENVMALCAGNKTHAAKALGFDRRTLYRKLGEWRKADAAAQGGGK